MPRIRPLPRSEAAPSVAAVYDMIFGKERDPAVSPGTSTGTPGGFFTTWGHLPDLLTQLLKYRPDPPVFSPALRGLACARAGYATQSQFTFSQNCKVARGAGVDEKKIEALPYWSATNDIYTNEERAVLAFTDAHILEGGRVHDWLFAELRKFLSEEQLLSLSFTICLYGMHARMAKGLRYDYDDVPDPIVEIPEPETKPGVQDWRDPKWADEYAARHST